MGLVYVVGPMVEGSVEGLTGLLEAIAGWNDEVWTGLWGSLKTPSNVPIFLSSLVKFSLGPTLAFGFSRWSVLRDEKRKEEKEAKAVRTLLKIEIEQNLDRLRQRQPKLEQATIRGTYGLWLFPDPEDNTEDKTKPDCRTMQRRGLDGQLSKLPSVLEAEDIKSLLAFYDTMENMFMTVWAPLPSDNDTKRRAVAAGRMEKLKDFLDKGNPLA